MSESNRKTIFTACCLCYQSCGVEVTVENDRVVAVKGQESHPMNKGIICAKGQAMIEHLYHPDRLKYPLKKVDGGWQEISWEQANSEIAAKLGQIKEEYGPSTLGFFCGSIGVENLEMGSLIPSGRGCSAASERRKRKKCLTCPTSQTRRTGQTP